MLCLRPNSKPQIMKNPYLSLNKSQLQKFQVSLETTTKEKFKTSPQKGKRLNQERNIEGKIIFGIYSCLLNNNQKMLCKWENKNQLCYCWLIVLLLFYDSLCKQQKKLLWKLFDVSWKEFIDLFSLFRYLAKSLVYILGRVLCCFYDFFVVHLG